AGSGRRRRRFEQTRRNSCVASILLLVRPYRCATFWRGIWPDRCAQPASGQLRVLRYWVNRARGTTRGAVMKWNLSVILSAFCALAFEDGAAKATTFTISDFSAACLLDAFSVACADNFNGFGLALSNTSNTPASNVVQAVAAGTPGQGFGAGVSTTTKPIRTNAPDTTNGDPKKATTNTTARRLNPRGNTSTTTPRNGVQTA